MFGWRKKYNVLFWIITISGLIGICALSVFEIIEYWLSMVFCFTFVALMFFEIARKAAEADKKMYKLLRDCKIEQYMYEINKIYDGTDHYRYKRIAAIDLANGYCAQGEFEKAAIVLNQYGPLQILNPRDVYSNAAYYATLADIYFKLGELEAAEEAADKLLALNREEGAETYKVFLDRMSIDINIFRMIANRRYDTAATLIEGTLTGNMSLYEQVSSKYDLALCYENLGEPQKARELYEFVAANGGDTYYAATAKEKLAAKPE